MAKLSGSDIRELAKKIIGEHAGGIRFTDLVNRISEASPETPVNTIHGSVWNLDALFPTEIIKPTRGLFLAANQATVSPNFEQAPVPPGPQAAAIREADFYASFADWLKNDLDEVTEVAAFGGASLASGQNGEHPM